MKTVVRRNLVAGLLLFAVALGLFLAVGGLRLWPRIAGQHLPFSLIWPFARPLLAAALELSFLVSVPVAAGLGAALTDVRPRRAVPWQASLVASALLVLVLGALSFGASHWLDERGSSPGELAAELVASARASCVESMPRAEVTVPLLGFSWLCEAGHAPRLQGRAPLGKQAEFQASAIALGADLKRIALTDFALAFPASGVNVEVHAAHATLSGLPPWGRARHIPLAVRAFLFALSSALSAFGVARFVARQPWLPAWAGGLFGASVSGCLWFALTWLERQEPRPTAYLALPACGLGGLVLLGLLVLFGRRLWLRWAGSRPSAATD